MAKKPPMVRTKYEVLDQLLRSYGLNAIDEETFWYQMRERGWGQSDIDEWLVEYYSGSRRSR